MPEVPEKLKCPFCLTQCIEGRPGATTCPICDTQFEIDDRLECFFCDTENIRLPAVGTICASCGLIQAESNQNCPFCGMPINVTVQ